jgi:hypothetical protein
MFQSCAPEEWIQSYRDVSEGVHMSRGLNMNNNVSKGVCISGDHCSKDVLQGNRYNTIEMYLKVSICPEE